MRRFCSRLAVPLSLTLVLAGCGGGGPGDTASVRVRFWNSVRSDLDPAGPYQATVETLSVDGKAVGSNLAFKTFSGEVALPPGTHTLAARLQGVPGPVSLSVDTAGGGHYTAYLFGTTTTPRLVTFPDDPQGTSPGAGALLLRFINLYADPGANVFISPGDTCAGEDPPPPGDRVLSDLGYARASDYVRFSPLPPDFEQGGAISVSVQKSQGFDTRRSCLTLRGRADLPRVNTVLLIDNGAADAGGSVVIVKE